MKRPFKTDRLWRRRLKFPWDNRGGKWFLHVLGQLQINQTETIVSLLMYLETFGCITNKRIVVSLSPEWPLAIETSNGTPLIPSGTILAIERPKPLSRTEVFGLFPYLPLKSWIFFFRLLTQLQKLRSQLRGSFFIWHSSVSSRAPLGPQTIDTNL